MFRYILFNKTRGKLYGNFLLFAMQGENSFFRSDLKTWLSLVFSLFSWCLFMKQHGIAVSVALVIEMRYGEE